MRMDDGDSLDPAWIKQETPNIVWPELRVFALPETASTNDEALQLARHGAPEGTLVIAECQTAGRGRKGRRWISPPGCGLYFSLILRPDQPVHSWVLLTHVAAIALANTFAELSREGRIPRGLEVELKWPNDVLLFGKKAAGILLETASRGGAPTAAVVGVGINVQPMAFPPELADQATCVSTAAGAAVSRGRILVRFLFHFQIGYLQFLRGDAKGILAQWKSMSHMWNNTPVWIIENGQARPAVTCGLTDNGALLVRTEQGTRETILAADVSIRRLERGEG